jgi:excisionase family DNA binding protein
MARNTNTTNAGQDTPMLASKPETGVDGADRPGDGAAAEPAYLLALGQAARRLGGVRISQVQRLLESGRLQGMQVGGAFRIPQSSIDTYLARAKDELLAVTLRVDEAARESSLTSALASLLLARARAAV